MLVLVPRARTRPSCSYSPSTRDSSSYSSCCTLDDLARKVTGAYGSASNAELERRLRVTSTSTSTRKSTRKSTSKGKRRLRVTSTSTRTSTSTSTRKDIASPDRDPHRKCTVPQRNVVLSAGKDSTWVQCGQPGHHWLPRRAGMATMFQCGHAQRHRCATNISNEIKCLPSTFHAELPSPALKGANHVRNQVLHPCLTPHVPQADHGRRGRGYVGRHVGRCPHGPRQWQRHPARWVLWVAAAVATARPSTP